MQLAKIRLGCPPYTAISNILKLQSKDNNICQCITMHNKELKKEWITVDLDRSVNDPQWIFSNNKQSPKLLKSQKDNHRPRIDSHRSKNVSVR